MASLMILSASLLDNPGGANPPSKPTFVDSPKLSRLFPSL